MKNLVLLLGMFILLGCTSEPPIVETPVVIEEPKKEVKEELDQKLDENKIAYAVIRASCLSLKATKDVMEADKVSAKDGGTLLRRLIAVGICGVYYPPRFGILEKLEISYVDSMGIKSQIWKLHGRDLWTIVAGENVKFKEKELKEEEVEEKTIKHSI